MNDKWNHADWEVLNPILLMPNLGLSLLLDSLLTLDEGDGMSFQTSGIAINDYLSFSNDNISTVSWLMVP